MLDTRHVRYVCRRLPTIIEKKTTQRIIVGFAHKTVWQRWKPVNRLLARVYLWFLCLCIVHGAHTCGNLLVLFFSFGLQTFSLALLWFMCTLNAIKPFTKEETSQMNEQDEQKKLYRCFLSLFGFQLLHFFSFYHSRLLCKQLCFERKWCNVRF